MSERAALKPNAAEIFSADRPLRVAVVVSSYNPEITTRLQAGALDELARRLGRAQHAAVIPAPGSFELPVLCSAAAKSSKFDAVVALGCIIKGETRHDQFIAAAIASELCAIGTRTGVPVAFGVLTTETDEQAEARAGGAMGNKGVEAMTAAIETVLALRRIAEA